MTQRGGAWLRTPGVPCLPPTRGHPPPSVEKECGSQLSCFIYIFHIRDLLPSVTFEMD